MKEVEGAEERDEDDEIPTSLGSSGAADAIVLGGGRAGTIADNPTAQAYLTAQTRLLGVQFEHMHEQRMLILEHLRVRKWRERLQLGLQIMLWSIAGLIIIAVVSFAFWTMGDDANIIEPFRSPAPLAAQGLDGPVLATKLLDGVRALVSETDTARAPSTMRGAGEDEIKVEIPETGVSIGELLKYLRLFLGHERHISGEAYLEGDDLVITVRTGEEPGRSFRGPRSAVGELMTKASEAVFEETQPYLYSVYLAQHGRTAESLETAQKLATSGPRRERGWAYAHWANLLIQRGDNTGAVVRAREALARDPRLVTAERNLAVASGNLGHAETSFEAWRDAFNLLRPGRRTTVTAAAADQTRADASESMDEALGDYTAAARLSRAQIEIPDYSGDARTAYISLADDLAEAHDPRAAEAILRKGGFSDDVKVLEYIAPLRLIAWPVADLDLSREDWAGAAADLAAAKAWLAAHASTAQDLVRTHVDPALARALAHLGRFAEADALLAPTPLDCDPCLLARGQTAALEGKSQLADAWFARAVARTPSLPRALEQWGEALLDRGDVRGAEEKAAAAERLGPNSANARDLRARALLKLGRKDEAVRELEAAVRLAPAWNQPRSLLDAARRGSSRPT